jgi:trehalose 6-phosphate synthase
VLVLSRFAGAAYELETALLVNPYDSDATAAAIKRALEMPLDERKERWSAMMRRLETNTVDRWCDAFLGTLVAADHQGMPAPSGDGEDDGLSPELSTGVRRQPLWGAIKN